MNKPQAENGPVCPFHNKDVSKVCHRCPLYIQVRGMDKNTGKEVDEWSCTIPMLAVLMIENSNQQRETGAAVESFRNEMVKANNMNTMMTALMMRKPNNDTDNYLGDHGIPSDHRIIGPSK